MNMYLEQYKKAFSHLIRHPILFAPDIFFFIIAAIMGVRAVFATGIIPFFQNFSIQTPQEMMDVFAIFIEENIGKLLATVITFLIATFFVGAGTLTLKYTMIRDMLSKKKPSLSGALVISRHYFWKIIGVRIFTFLIYSASALISLLILGILRPIHQGTATAVTFLFILVSTIAISLSLYTKYPLLFKKNLSPLASIVSSYNFFKTNKSFIIIVAVIIAMTRGGLQSLANLLIQIGIIIPPLVIIAALLILIAKVFADVYLFQVVESYKGEK